MEWNVNLCWYPSQMEPPYGARIVTHELVIKQRLSVSACVGSGNCMLMRTTYLELLYEYSHSTQVRGKSLKRMKKV